MRVTGLTPILNVSDIRASFDWFAKLGWRRGFEWGDPPTFGSVVAEKCEIFLCQGAQGGRGKGSNTTTFGDEANSETADKGVWMSLWIDDVDAAHAHCLVQGIEVMFPPTDMPWGVREMHVRHPDGHVFRIGRGNEDAEDCD